MTLARDLRPSHPLFAALALVLLLQAAAQLVPLPPAPDLTLASTFGVHDNRRLLLRYGALAIALWLAPWLTRPAPHLESPAVSARSWRRSLCFTIPFALGGFWLFFGPGIPMAALNGHEMVHLGYLSQMRRGALLNVDTFMNYGPLLGASIFGFMKVVGFHLVGFRWYWHAAALVTWILIVLAGWKNLRQPLLVLLLALYAVLYTAAVSFLPDRAGFYHAAWGWANPLRHGAPVLCIVFLGPPLLRARRMAALIAGCLVVATLFYAQETGVASLVALGTLLVLGARTHRSVISQIVMFSAGLVAAFLVVTLPALVRGEMGSFLRATFEAPRIVLEGAANKPFPALDGPSSWPYYVVPLVTLGLLLWHGRRARRGSHADAVPFALATYGSIAFVTMLVRADRSHLLNIALCFWMLVFLGLDRLFRRQFVTRPWIYASLAVLILFFVVLPPGAGAIVHAMQGRFAHPEPPPGWMKLDLDRGGIWVPHGEWFEGEPQNHGDVRGVTLIKTLADDRPTQILGSQASLYYFLTGVRAAVPYTDLATQCVTEYHRRRLIATYFRNKPELTFMFTEFESNPPRPATGYRRIGERFGLGIYRREDLPPITLP
jgi:hypothetical protein